MTADSTAWRTAKQVIISGLALIGMVAFYYGLLWFTTKDPLHPVYFFVQKWYFLLPIFLGFGTQVYLLQKIHFIHRVGRAKMLGSTAGINGVAMAACCAHHLADIAPLLGLFGLAGVATRYQNWFLGVAAVINILAVGYLFYKLRHAKCA